MLDRVRSSWELRSKICTRLQFLGAGSSVTHPDNLARISIWTLNRAPSSVPRQTQVCHCQIDKRAPVKTLANAVIGNNVELYHPWRYLANGRRAESTNIVLIGWYSTNKHTYMWARKWTLQSFMNMEGKINKRQFETEAKGGWFTKWMGH